MTSKDISEANETNRNRNCSYWVREDEREFIADPAGEDVVNLARLTAYAEYGKEIYGAHIHHEIPRLKIDAPAFLDVLEPGEHLQLHNSDRDLVHTNGIPLLRAEP
jgi:hypothetical protein